MLAPIIQISPLTKIRRHRELPVPGKVLVRQSQKVEALDTVAETILAPEHLMLDIASSLYVSTEKADDLIQHAAGEMIQKDDLIAGPVGITQRVVRAPRSGRIVVAGDGLVLLQVNSTPYEVHAGMPGTVTDLIPDRGAVIEATGALIQGVWGNDQTEFGMMQVRIDSPDDKLTADDLDVSLRGAIVLGGYCADPQIFQKAADIPLRGLIFTSMDSSLVRLARKAQIPVLILEGFGFHPLSAIGYNLLTSNNGREVSLNAEARDHYNGTRPEIVIPLDASQAPEDASLAIEDFAKGQSVRIVRAPHQGKSGKIETIYSQPIKFPSGVRALGAEVVLSDNERTTIPLVNLEKIA
ncbi:MAG: hypothetical protein ISR58_00855 [Anaerolineales bacterium]|nr:hypothetical protein [Chloroflexota bacterium]MBL6979713.1 hypothetical protein [Anaerolineales bacterium]